MKDEGVDDRWSMTINFLLIILEQRILFYELSGLMSSSEDLQESSSNELKEVQQWTFSLKPRDRLGTEFR